MSGQEYCLRKRKNTICEYQERDGEKKRLSRTDRVTSPLNINHETPDEQKTARLPLLDEKTSSSDSPGTMATGLQIPLSTLSVRLPLAHDATGKNVPENGQRSLSDSEIRLHGKYKFKEKASAKDQGRESSFDFRRSHLNPDSMEGLFTIELPSAEGLKQQLFGSEQRVTRKDVRKGKGPWSDEFCESISKQDLDDCEGTSSTVTGNDKRSKLLLLYTVPISCWPDVNQSKISIRNMLNYCESVEKKVGLKPQRGSANIDNVDIYIDPDIIEIESVLPRKTTFEKKKAQFVNISEVTGKENLSTFKGVVIDSDGVKIIRSLLGSSLTVNKAGGYLNVRDCDKETIRTETKYIIERVVFEPLIEKCEFLGRVIDALNAASIKKVSKKSHVGEKDQTSRDNLRRKVSLKLDDTNQEEQEVTDDFSDSDKCFDEKTLGQFNQQRDTVEDLYEEMVASILRSRLKKEDLTRLQESRQNRYVSREVSQELFQREKSVKGCGFRLKSFHVDVEELPTKEENNDRERRIRDYLNACSINNVKFNFVSPKPEEYSCVGAELYLKCGSGMNTGTLGCFAKHSKDNESCLCALISKHVAQGCSTEILIRGEDQQLTPFGELLSDTVVDGGHDIAAARVCNNQVPGCDMGFKNVDGERVPGELYNVGDTTNLQGNPIHLWGAMSKPGIGRIIVQHYHFPDDTESYIKVQDGCIALGKPDAILAKRGDSGAIVCMDESCGAKVKAMSILMGPINEFLSQEDPKVKTKYLTLPLSSGLQTLENRTHGKFQLEGAESS